MFFYSQHYYPTITGRGVGRIGNTCTCLEETVQAEVPDSMAQVKRSTHIPIATGERLFSRWGFRRILETEAASLLQPDAGHAGGISEVRKIGTMVEAYYAGLAHHNPYGPVSTAACIQVDFTAPNFVIQDVVDPDDIPEVMTFIKEPLPILDDISCRLQNLAPVLKWMKWPSASISQISQPTK